MLAAWRQRVLVCSALTVMLCACSAGSPMQGVAGVGGGTAGTVAGVAASGSGAAGVGAGTGAAGTIATGDGGAADGGDTGDAGSCPVFDVAFVDSLRGCTTDVDCAVTRYQRDCCGTNVVVGVAKTQVDRLHACAPMPSGFAACGCPTQPTLADDGRISEQFDLSDVAARCTAGHCEARVVARTCGTSTTCAADELCVVFETLVGPSSSLDYACVKSPCTGVLDCECAAPLCAARTDTTRACSIAYPPDVYCSDLSQ